MRILGLVLFVAFGGLCAAVPRTSCAADESRRAPNFLVILADDMGFSDAGCYGGEIQTPHLDALARDGLRFTQFYNTARCWPTRGAILTGYYAQQIRRDSVPGVTSGSGGKRPAWAKLLPEMLKPRGYRTYHSGKWHVDGRPLQNGFDRSYDLIAGQHNFFRGKGNTEEEQPVAERDDYYATSAIADHAIKCLREHAESHSKQPFFHYLCFTAPHFPLHALPEDIARYRDTYQVGWNTIAQQRHGRMKTQGIIRHDLPVMEREVGPPYHFADAFKTLGAGEVNRPLPWTELNDEQRAFQAAKMSIHAAMIDRMDREIGRVLEQLRTMNAFDDTLILFLSDNGASAEIMVRGEGHDPQASPGSAKTFLCLGPGWSSAANTPMRRHKTWVHEGGISTPLIAHWPRGITAKGELRHQPGHVIDVVPTVLELAGAQAPKEVDGKPVPPSPARSLVPALTGNGPVAHDEIWWLHEGNRALRVGDWKLVAAGANGPWELYDLSRDRGESTNLAEQHPERVRELAARWTARSDEYAALARVDAPPAEKPAQNKGKANAAKKAKPDPSEAD